MNLQPSDLLNNYSFLDNLIQAVNTFASLQDYVVVKKKTKVNKKKVLKKVVLMYDWSKKYFTKSYNKIEEAN